MLKTGNDQINSKIYWDYIYTTPAKEQDYWSETNRFPKALEYVKKGDKFLDLGCGVAIPARLAKEKGCEVWGVDISEEIIKKNQKEEPSIKFIRGEVGNLGFLPESYFDVVFSGETLEHLDNPADLLGDAYRVLKKGGRLIITTPQGDGIQSPEHMWYFDKDDIVKFFTDAGFRDIEFVDLPDLEHVIVFFVTGIK